MNVDSKRILIGHGNTFHDPAVCIAQGDRFFAEAIERHIQCKRAWDLTLVTFSDRIIKRALKEHHIETSPDAEVRFLESWDTTGMTLGAEVGSRLTLTLEKEGIFRRQMRAILHQRNKDAPSLSSIYLWAPDPNWGQDRKKVEHHLAHAANGIFTSPFTECVALVMDGAGEKSSIEIFHYRDNEITRIGNDATGKDPQINSLGFLYMAVTVACGFSAAMGEEWKIMGLAAWGKERKPIYDFFRERITPDGWGFRIQMGAPDWALLAQLVGGFRDPEDPDVYKAADLAHNFQKAFEDVVLDLINRIGALGLSTNLVISGGCALNSSLNGKVIGRTPFTRLHVPSAPADDGNALGIVLHEKYIALKEPRKAEAMSPYLGSYPDMSQLKKALSFDGLKYREAADQKALCAETVDLLMKGQIIGWMQGAAEFGPRALGNRSILADPRVKDMKKRINDRVKFREEYRPLAPSILHEFGPEYFENYQESPYMERALLFRQEVRERVPAVVHEDGTGRLQTVKHEWNPLYHDLIRTFYEKTGIPLLLNTSLNVMGKPIVHGIEDAITVLCTTGIDAMIIGNYIIFK